MPRESHVLTRDYDPIVLTAMRSDLKDPRVGSHGGPGVVGALLPVLAFLAVIDGGVGAPFLTIPMVALGCATLAGHFLGRRRADYRRDVRAIALLAAVGLAGSATALAIESGSIQLADLRLLLSWMYWLGLFVVAAERTTWVQLRRAMVAAVGFAASVVALARIAELVFAGNIGTSEPLLFSRTTYGAILAILMPLAIVAWASKSRGAAIACVLVFALAIVLNGSRGSWVVTLVWVAAVAFAASREPGRTLTRRRASLVLFVALSLCALGVATVTYEALEPVRSPRRGVAESRG